LLHESKIFENILYYHATTLKNKRQYSFIWKNCVKALFFRWKNC